MQTLRRCRTAARGSKLQLELNRPTDHLPLHAADPATLHRVQKLMQTESVPTRPGNRGRIEPTTCGCFNVAGPVGSGDLFPVSPLSTSFSCRTHVSRPCP